MCGTSSSGQAHPEVATRHHHAVGDVEDVVEVGDGRAGLDLGHHHRPVAADDPPDRGHVVGGRARTTPRRRRRPPSARRRGGAGRPRSASAGRPGPRGATRPAGRGARPRSPRPRPRRRPSTPSVTTSTTPPSPSATRSPGCRAPTAPSRATRHHLGVARVAGAGVGEAQRGARTQQHAVVGEGRRTHLRARAGRRGSRLAGRRPLRRDAHPIDPIEGGLEGTVRQAQPAHVGARLEQAPQHGRRIRGRADGGHDLGATHGHACDATRSGAAAPTAYGAVVVTAAATAALRRRWTSTLAAGPCGTTSTWTPPAASASATAGPTSSHRLRASTP